MSILGHAAVLFGDLRKATVAGIWCAKEEDERAVQKAILYWSRMPGNWPSKCGQWARCHMQWCALILAQYGQAGYWCKAAVFHNKVR